MTTQIKTNVTLHEVTVSECEHCAGSGKVCNDGKAFTCPKCNGYGDIKEIDRVDTLPHNILSKSFNL